MSTNRVYNFNAGPACLPLEVVEQVRDGFMDFGGMSVLEISHRSKAFEAVLDEARSLVAELMGVPKGYHILFLQGGASLQFAMVPMNLMGETADYAVTGYWAKKAFAESKLVGSPRIAFSSEETGFDRTPAPSEIKVNDGASYVHITTNNTICGTQYRAFPDTGGVPLVADMSSDIMSRDVDVSRFGLIYAGAQKNIGPAGVTMVIIRDDLAKAAARPLPAMLKYSTHADGGSLFNTPPVFAIYVTMLMLRWVKRQGGLTAMERANEEKAALLYDAIDRSSFYKSRVEKNSRSRMNVVFTLPDEELTKRFLALAGERGMVGLKGHRSVGGIRASIYNAFPREGVEALVQLMKEFEANA
ncbi:MAG: 3-phosphoserine/phosphohydroxythreonine transaminase [Pseudomonadota bacterium]